MSERTVCEYCGRELEVGDYPYCPHGNYRGAIRPDEVPGGFWAENGFDTPRKFYSHSEHEAALAAEGLEIRAKHAGPHDKIMSNWAARIDPVTLANAAALVSRGAEAPQARRTRRFATEVAPGDRFPVTIERSDAGPVQCEEVAR